MLTHVVTEVLEQRHFLRQSVGKLVQCVEMFGVIALDILHVSTISRQQSTIYCKQVATVTW